ncbi:RNA polymerase II subunit A C-terminal domain phosphatase isoform X2 [Takifugu rubripes]|nr:RNA polymerase II subunit A C-terminal domain phosphatase isoform X2 [Takifugu rubripes]|eukprot:XP_011607495.1 PREDICTED: RNA polymerase II subunit A C-terminal domain phosphatase isoform X2 [Takifugu rubripes]
MEDPSADSVGGGGGTASMGPGVQAADICSSSSAAPLRLLEWKVKVGSVVNVDSVLALCAPILEKSGTEAVRVPEKKVRSDRAGVITELCCQLGQVIAPGGVIVRMEQCSHPIVMKGLCAECGQDLTQLQSTNGSQQSPISTATVSMVHSVPELMVSAEQAEQLGREDQQRLHRNKKLVLMVDLDQTLIHTTEQHCQRMSNKGILHFQLGRGEPMLHTRLRPHCKEFLEKIAKLYELHVFTFGSRLYAHTIAGFLDPEKKLFSHRILSRDECIDPFSKTGNLRNLFPCGDSMVCIIDDREDVWKFAPNLVTVKKYVYFQGTGDINAPPGSRDAQTAQTERKGGPSSGSTESTETVRTLGGNEQNNGPRKKGKDQNNSGNADSTTCQSSQGIPSNERTSPTGEDKPGQGKGSGQKDTQVDSTDSESNRTLDKPELQDSANSSGPSHESNNLDFDLSSDSDNDMSTDKPSAEHHGEAKSCHVNKSEQEVAGQEDSKGLNDEENTSKEPSDILLPDPDPENANSDKREPETESQNSEQSGITTGEELLDQSIEDEDDEDEADNDEDDHLIYLEEVLERVHAEYYARYEAYLGKEAPESPDIRKIVPELKSKTLEGATIVFSGLYPTNYPIEKTREYYHAKALGATISRSLILSTKGPGQTTHLIAARAGTEKVRQAQGCKHLRVVNPDWLWSCLERWERVEEQLYPLKEDYSKKSRSSSPAAFHENLSSLQKHVFQAAAIRHKPVPPAPEIRTYDPVTGKLIRRGPQVSRPPVFQTPGPLAEQSCLRGTSNCQPAESAGSSQDDEQPGPSRRKRQLSMSETMPLYTLCKEDLDSMDREVDDILGEESDNESEGRGKDKPGNEEDDEQQPQQQPESAEMRCGGSGPQALGLDERTPEPSGENDTLDCAPRGHKRKHSDEEEEEDVEKEEEAAAESLDESSKDSNEEEGSSSSEADEMAAALEAELNDFI